MLFRIIQFATCAAAVLFSIGAIAYLIFNVSKNMKMKTNAEHRDDLENNPKHPWNVYLRSTEDMVRWHEDEYRKHGPRLRIDDCNQ